MSLQGMTRASFASAIFGIRPDGQAHWLTGLAPSFGFVPNRASLGSLLFGFALSTAA
jgi:hypothetical protein